MYSSPRCPFYGGGSVIVDLLFNIHPIVCGGSVFDFVLLCITCVLFSLAIVLKRRGNLLPFFYCLTNVLLLYNNYALWLFLTVLWVDLQCVIMVFPDHTHLLFYTVTII